MRTKAFPIPIVRFAPFRAIFKDVLSGNSYVSFIQGKLRKSISNYQEGYASLELGAGFFRPDSILARDLSVLIASMQYQEQKEKKVLLQVLIINTLQKKLLLPSKFLKESYTPD